MLKKRKYTNTEKRATSEVYKNPREFNNASIKIHIWAAQTSVVVNSLQGDVLSI